LAVSVARNVPFAGAFAVRLGGQSELQISEANAGAKLPECIGCPVLTGSTSQCAEACYALGVCAFVSYSVYVDIH